MKTALAYGRVPDDVTDVEGKKVNKTWNLLILCSIVLLLTSALLVVIGWSHISSLKEENATHVEMVRVQGLQIAKHKTETTTIARLEGELSAEVARKNKLAVENTRLLGRVTQGERDLAAALEKLKTYEKPKRK